MSNPKGPKKPRFLQKVKEEADDSKNVRLETLYISDYEFVNISTFALSDIKWWLEEDGDLNTHHPLYSFRFIQWGAQNWYIMLLSRYNFIFNIVDLTIFAYS